MVHQVIVENKAEKKNYKKKILFSLKKLRNLKEIFLTRIRIFFQGGHEIDPEHRLQI